MVFIHCIFPLVWSWKVIAVLFWSQILKATSIWYISFSLLQEGIWKWEVGELGACRKARWTQSSYSSFWQLWPSLNSSKIFMLQQSRSSMPQCTSLRIAPTCNGLQEDKCSECLLAEMFHLPHEPSLSLLHPLHDMTKEEKNQYFFEGCSWERHASSSPKTVNKLVRASVQRKSGCNLQSLLACLGFPSKNQCIQSASSLQE